ncbi:MAG: 1-acyl-sn-glycerol-3-phosphate acyltransferase [Flavobacteriia bacterium]|nr:1-acyl-sn-glycerol-3-phosphate acyltransferase [Flavobacteriia bacterium]
MKKAIGKFIYFIFGWKLSVEGDKKEFGHSVMVAAPHTTNWDFLFAIAGFWIMELDVRYFIKDTYTKSIIGFLFKWTGALGVNREARNNLVQHTIDLLNEHDQMVILVPAEGTRKKVDKWRKGFYHIAKGANVPISMGFLDYEKKIGGVAGAFWPTDDEAADFQVLQDTYKRFKGKFPENYNEQIY